MLGWRWWHILEFNLFRIIVMILAGIPIIRKRKWIQETLFTILEMIFDLIWFPNQTIMITFGSIDLHLHFWGWHDPKDHDKTECKRRNRDVFLQLFHCYISDFQEFIRDCHLSILFPPHTAIKFFALRSELEHYTFIIHKLHQAYLKCWLWTRMSELISLICLIYNIKTVNDHDQKKC